uniref:Uncharacterized protein n=1 Tax=Anguilla anguilla TaxID=7936 RepID=A0A0E9PLZ5_ANGAN
MLIMSSKEGSHGASLHHAATPSPTFKIPPELNGQLHRRISAVMHCSSSNRPIAAQEYRKARSHF